MVLLEGGSTLREEIELLDPPRRFGYRVSDFDYRNPVLRDTDVLSTLLGLLEQAVRTPPAPRSRL